MDNTELIARLQSRTASMYLLEDVKLFHEAADAIQAAQAEIERHKLHIKHIGNDALRTENAKLMTALAECRDAFPVPKPDTEIDGWYVSAMADPLAVPAYVKACLAVQPGWKPTDASMTALRRFEETCADGEGYDVPKDTMKQLALIGLVAHLSGGRYVITDFGQSMLAAAPSPKEGQP